MRDGEESGLRKFLWRRRFSKEEYRELGSIGDEERKKLLKRPQYIIGNLLITGLTLYFLIRAVGPERFALPSVGDVVGVLAGVGIAMGVIWVILRIPKLKSKLGGWFVWWWGAWMMCFGILMNSGEESSGVRWQYLVYTAIVFFGWLCVSGAVMEHLCEMILKMRKEKRISNNEL